MARTPEQNFELYLEIRRDLVNLLFELKSKRSLPIDYLMPSQKVGANKKADKE